MSDNARKEPRFPIAAVVPLWPPGSGVSVECSASDISTHGLFLEMAAPLEVETMVRIGPVGVRVRARVVFVLAPDQAAALGRKPGVGLQLEEVIDPDAFLLSCAEDAAASRAAGTSSGKAKPAAFRPPGMALPAPPPSSPSNPTLPGASRSAASAPAPARRRIDVKEHRAEAKVLEVVVIDDGTAVFQTVVQALVSDGYAPLVARHALEAFALVLKRGPVLAILQQVEGASSRLVIEEIRKRSDLDATTLILVDPSDEADPTLQATARWRSIPDDIARVRGGIDRVLEAMPISADARTTYDARSIGESIASFAHGLADRGMFDQAVPALRYTGELAPTVAGHPLRLARMLLAQNDVVHHPEATALVERVLSLEPRSVDALILRALLADLRHERDAARVALQRALQIDSGRQETTDLLARLEKGQPLVGRTTFGEAKANKGSFGGRLKKLFGG